MIYLITIATFFSTLLGGLFAVYLKDQLHLILGFSAGAVIGVAFFDLLPEALDLTSSTFSTSTVFSVVAVGFALYLILDRMFLKHGHGATKHEEEERGIAGASSLSLHSFLDGVGIGLAFQVSSAVGIIVAAAVLAHDFSDGINTVSFVLSKKGDRKRAIRWLIIDAIAPLVGVISTRFFVLSAPLLGLLLALFSGFFLYIGATDLIPESYHAHPVRWTTAMTLLGISTLYIIIKLASI